MDEFARLASEESKQNARNVLIKHFNKPNAPLDVIVDLDGGIMEDETASITLDILNTTGRVVELKCHQYVDSSGTFWFIGVVDGSI